MLEEVRNPKQFFDLDSSALEEVVCLVRRAFGREMEFDDIYRHVTCPEKVYLLKKEEKVVAMASYNQKVLSGIPSLIVEGIAVTPEMQGKGVFRKITNQIGNNEAVICLRTQNPRMYRALESYCSTIYPGEAEIPKAIEAIREDFASYLGQKIDGNGIIRGYYGGLFYGVEPKYEKVSNLFEKLGINLNNGDALLVIGVK